MTRKEASKILYALWRIYHHYLTEKEAEAVDMAIEALKQPVEYRCRICKSLNNIRVYDYYCPKCGTKMREVIQ